MNNIAAVSVVVPCYACPQTIGRAVASVAGQTLVPAELILVDDYSPDQTRQLLQELAVKYWPGWIKLVLLDQNVGAASARNAGWALASQPYVAFLDADDAWHPQKIEIQCAYMDAHPEVVLCGHRHRIQRQNDALPAWVVSQGRGRPIKKWMLLLSNKFVTPSVIVRRDIGHRFVEKQRHMEDHMLWLKIVCGGGRVVMLPAELTAIYKSSYGVKGLSAQFWPMERGDLGNYRRLYHAGCINVCQFGLLSIYSLLKYFRRLLIYFCYLRWTKS